MMKYTDVKDKKTFFDMVKQFALAKEGNFEELEDVIKLSKVTIALRDAIKSNDDKKVTSLGKKLSNMPGGREQIEELLSHKYAAKYKEALNFYYF